MAIQEPKPARASKCHITLYVVFALLFILGIAPSQSLDDVYLARHNRMPDLDTLYRHRETFHCE